jgi:hypothetical protein
VVGILSGQFRPHSVNSQGFKFQHGHGSRGILKQGMVDPNSHLFVTNDFSLNKMGV